MTTIQTDNDVLIQNSSTYSDYLNHFVDAKDLFYMRNREMCQRLAFCKPRQSSPLTQQQFEKRKAFLMESKLKGETGCYSLDMTSNDRLLVELAARELPNKNKDISTIIYIEGHNKDGHNISGYIDYEASLRAYLMRLRNCIKWRLVFKERHMITARPHHLSYINWYTKQINFNSNENYMVMHDPIDGLSFIHKGDHHKIWTDPALDKKNTFKNFQRTMIYSKLYGFVILYDHFIRKKT